MTHDAFQLLSSLLAYAGEDIAAGQYASTDELEPLVRAGWLLRTGLPSVITCEACEEPHAAELVNRGPNPRALCVRTGDTFDVSTHVALYRVEVGAVAHRLARALQLDGEARDVKAIPTLWRLGTRSLFQTRVMLYFTPHLEQLDLAAAIIEAVAFQSGALRSGLIVASDKLEHIRLLTQRVAVMRLREIASLGADGEFAVNEAELASAVLPDLSRGRSPGAPANQREKILPILDAMLTDGLTIDTSNKTCREVQERFGQLHPSGHVPAKATIISAITDSKK